MINYIVRDVETLIEKLSVQGVSEVDKLRTDKYGKFVTVMDPDGNKVEFWEPDNEFFSNKYE